MAPSVYAFRPGEKIRPGFIRLLKKISAQSRLLPAEEQTHAVEAIHEGRTLIKHTRSLLWFAKPVLGESVYTQAKNRLRQAAHLLSSQRDYAVTKSILKKLDPSLQDLVKNGHVQGRSRNSLATAVDLLRKTVNEAKKKSDTSSKKWPSPRDRLDKAYQGAHKAEKKALHKGNDVAFHSWRKKAKRLLYQLELTKPQPKKKEARFIHHIDRLQKRLGDYHDCVIVQDRFQKKITTPALHIKYLMEKRKRRLRKKIRKIAASI